MHKRHHKSKLGQGFGYGESVGAVGDSAIMKQQKNQTAPPAVRFVMSMAVAVLCFAPLVLRAAAKENSKRPFGINL